MIDAVLLHPWTQEKGRYPPLGLLCLAAYAEERGFDVRLCDAAALGLSEEEVAERLGRLRPRCVGLSFMTPQYSHALALAAVARRTLPDALLVAGGVHANVLPAETLREIPALDCIALGEGELTFVELLGALRRGDRDGLRRIPGLALRDGVVVARTSPRPLVADLAAFPAPAWHAASIDRYEFPAAEEGKTPEAAITIHGSRGCPHRCIFCAVSSVFGHGHRYRPPAQIAEEIAGLASRHGLRRFMFVDDVLFQRRDQVLALCGELGRRHLRVEWSGCARADSRALDAEVLAAVARAGCTRIQLGAESGSPAMLREIAKGVTVEQLREAHRRVHAHGMATTTYLMVGHPSETMDDVRLSARLIAELETEEPLVGRETPFPGTDLHALATARGWLRSGEWSEHFTHNLHPVMRTLHFDAEGLVRASHWLRRLGEIFAALARERRRGPLAARSRWALVRLFTRLLADRHRAPHEDELQLGARARAVEGWLAKDADPARFDASLAGLGLQDLVRLALPSARPLAALVGGFPAGTRVLVVPNTSVGAVLPVLRSLCRAEGVREVGFACSEVGRCVCEQPGVADPKLTVLHRGDAELAAAIADRGALWDAVLVPCRSFSGRFYLALVLRLLLALSTSRPLYVVALGTGGNVIEVAWRPLARELWGRAAARARALLIDRARALPAAWRLAALARRWGGSRVRPGRTIPRT